MGIISKTSVKAHFNTGDKPTEGDFEDLVDSAMRDPLIAIATAAEGGGTGIPEITATAAVTLRSVGAVGGELLGAATTASAQGHLGAGSLGSILLGAVTTASAQGHLGAGAVGIAIFEATTTASVQGVVDAQADVITTRGDVVRGDATGAAERLALGVSDTFFGSDGTDPSWVAAATQAEMEAGSVTNKPTTPGRQQFHPSAAKAWIKGSYSAGVPQDDASYNVTSLDDDGVGLVGVNFTTAMSTANYAAGASSPFSSGGDETGPINLLVGSFDIRVDHATGGAQDRDFCGWALGDQ